MKLIKINTDHYIIVDDSEIKEGDWIIDSLGIRQVTSYEGVKAVQDANHIKKITHSTLALEPVDGTYIYYKIKPLSLQEVKKLIGEVDVDKFELFLDREAELKLSPKDTVERIKWYYQTYFKEDNKDKKYTEEDLRVIIIQAWYNGAKQSFEGKTFITDNDQDEIIQSLQPKTEWEVEMIDGQLKLKQ